LRRRYGLNILAVAIAEKFEINPSPVMCLQKDWLMVVIGTHQGIDQLPE